MASLISATTTQGVQVTGDTSGALALQTNNGTTAVTIDTSQNVGIGTASPTGKLEVAGSLGNFYVENNGARLFFTRNSANYIRASGAAGELAFETGGSTERMRIDSSGKVGIGTSSPLSLVDLGSAYVTPATNTAADVKLAVTTISSTEKYGFFVDNTASLVSLSGANGGGGQFRWVSGSTERMRIDSSGNVLVNTTSQLQAGRFCVAFDGAANNAVVLNDTTAAASIAYMYFSRGGTTRGSITYNGTLVAYNATSDERLKENIVDADSALPTLSKIQVRSFDWIDSKTHETHGVVAQELQKVVPQCVTEGKDNEDGSIDIPWQVDTSPLIPMLVKAIQELKAEVDTLKAQLEAK